MYIELGKDDLNCVCEMYSHIIVNCINKITGKDIKKMTVYYI